MNLIKLFGATQTKAQKDAIVRYVGKSPKRFAELVTVFINGPHHITQRAAWPLTYCVENHPELLTPQLRKILAATTRPGVHDAVKRNVVRMLQFAQIPRTQQGAVADLCFGFLADTREPVAIRVFSMTVLANLAAQEPDLKNEIIPLIEGQLPYATAAFRSRGFKVLKRLKKE